MMTAKALESWEISKSTDFFKNPAIWGEFPKLRIRLGIGIRRQENAPYEVIHMPTANYKQLRAGRCEPHNANRPARITACYFGESLACG